MALPRNLVYCAWWRSDDGRVLTVRMVGNWVSLGSCARTRPVGWSVISLVASVLPEPGELVWLKHNGVYRLRTLESN